jgi:hypothetical protein
VDRRTVLSGVAATLALAGGGAAQAAVQQAKLSAFYPYLELYLSLPPAQRSLFGMAYYVFRDRKPAPDVKAFIVSPNGAKRPIPLDREARVLYLPSLAELRGPDQGMVDAPPGQKVGLALEIEARVPLSPAVDPRVLTAALAQANAAIQSHAGLLAFAVPKLTCAYLVNAGTGRAQLADGHSIGLPVSPKGFFAGQSYFDTEALGSAKALALTRAPSRILLGGHPR